MPTIRAYTSADEASWLKCRLLSFFGTNYYDDVKTAKTRLAPGSIELVAERDGRVVGILDVEIAGNIATIDTIAVHPDAQRGGLGTAMLDVALAALPEGVTTLDAWTREDAAANAWYGRAGFRETFRYLHVYVGDGDPTFPGPEGMSSPVIALVHAAIDRESELRAAYQRVYVCRRYVRIV